MKVRPLQRLKKRVFKHLLAHHGKKVLVLTGKRWDESAHRKADMMCNGEVPWEPVLRDGEQVLCPIAHFTLDDIYTVIGLVRSKLIDTYSDFDDLVRVYKGANGGACMINAMEGQSTGAGCGQRFGCWTCMRVANDRSMEEMLEQDAYAYMRPLNQLRNYILSRHHDPASRNWLGRSVDDQGCVPISPNSYSPEFCEEMLTMALSIQAEEYAWANANQCNPRFRMISPVQLMAIEVSWLRYGFHRPFQAHRIMQKVESGERLFPPEVGASGKVSALKPTGHKVGFADADYVAMFSGLRDLDLAVIDQEATTTVNGHVYSDVRCDGFEIDEESVELFTMFELDHYMRRYGGADDDPSSALMALMRLGVVSIRRGSQGSYDRMMRVARKIRRFNLRPVLNNPVSLMARLAAGEGKK